MSRLFQIYEQDLADLERLLPILLESRPETTARDRVQVRRVMQIITNVRWNYGPHANVEYVAAGEITDDNDEEKDDREPEDEYEEGGSG